MAAPPIRTSGAAPDSNAAKKLDELLATGIPPLAATLLKIYQGIAGRSGELPPERVLSMAVAATTATTGSNEAQIVEALTQALAVLDGERKQFFALVAQRVQGVADQVGGRTVEIETEEQALREQIGQLQAQLATLGEEREELEERLRMAGGERQSQERGFDAAFEPRRRTLAALVEQLQSGGSQSA